MFGYIVMNKPEIKFKDFDLYRSFYCGLCRELKSKYGISGQISLTYDMTFVVILLSERPLQTDTANASIDRPIASIKSSKIFMCFLLLFLYKIIFQ